MVLFNIVHGKIEIKIRVNWKKFCGLKFINTPKKNLGFWGTLVAKSLRKSVL